MKEKVKYLIKKVFSMLGLYHPSLGIKISAERKAQILLGHKKPNTRIFVETGTETGRMVNWMKNHFEKIYSIELDENLYKGALQMFKDDGKVKLVNGDSGQKIVEVLSEIKESALFWLDAHPSGAINADNTPIVPELDTILGNSFRHTVLIDDARHFDLKLIKMMREIVKKYGYKMDIKEGLFIIK